MVKKILFVFLIVIFCWRLPLFAQLTVLDQQANLIEFGLVNNGKSVANFKLEKSSGNFSLFLKDEELKNINYFETVLGPNITHLSHDVLGDEVVFVGSLDPFTSNRKVILKGDLKTGDFKKYTYLSSIVVPAGVKVINKGVVIQGAFEGGHFLEIFDFETETVQTVTEILGTQFKILDFKGGELTDVLVLEEGKSKQQRLQIFSFDHQGKRIMNVHVRLPSQEKFYIQQAQLVDSKEGLKAVGTYSDKKGEWFSGYFHFSIDEEMKFQFRKFLFKDLEGFYDYRKNSPKIKRKRLNKEVMLVEAVTDGEFVTLAAVVPSAERKFIHLLHLNANGEKVFDKSIKLYYNVSLYWAPYHLAIDQEKVYFAYRGNENRKNPPGEKIYLIEKREEDSAAQVRRVVVQKNKLWQLMEPHYQYWHDGKFLVYGVSRNMPLAEGKPVFILEPIDSKE